MTPRPREGVADGKSLSVGEDHEFGCQRPMGPGLGQLGRGERASGTRRVEASAIEAVSVVETAPTEKRSRAPTPLPPHTLGCTHGSLWPSLGGGPWQALLPVSSLGRQGAEGPKSILAN